MHVVDVYVNVGAVYVDVTKGQKRKRNPSPFVPSKSGG